MRPLGATTWCIGCTLVLALTLAGCKKDKGPRCGDGVIEGNEVCDSTNLAGETCASVSGEPDGELRCAPDCLAFEDAACHECGNGELEGNEDCEGDVGSTACADLGYAGGTLTCLADCHFDESRCHSCGDGLCQGADGENSDECPEDCGWSDVAVGLTFSCGLIRGTGPFCWGEGAGPLAVLMHGGTGLRSIVNSSGATLGIDHDDVVWLWLQANPTPPDTPELDHAVELSAFGGGSGHYCFITSAGQAWCNGANEFGQLGDSTLDTPTAPVQVAGLSDVVSIAVGAQHSCAVTGDGAVWCWGEGTAGRLGDGAAHDTCDVASMTFDCAPSPVQVASLSDAVFVTAGGHHSCAVTATGEVHCWGLDNRGQLGDGPGADVCTTPSGDLHCRETPEQVAGLTEVVQASAGTFHTCAVYSERVNCWGANDAGQLGNNATMDADSPVSAPLLRVQKVVAAETHTCALSTDGALHCWGQNTYGQLGDGTLDNALGPVEVVDSTDVP